jgi:hypothetical protein
LQADNTDVSVSDVQPTAVPDPTDVLMKRPARILLTFAATTSALAGGGIAVAAVTSPTTTAASVPSPPQSAHPVAPSAAQLNALLRQSAAVKAQLHEVDADIALARRRGRAHQRPAAKSVEAPLPAAPVSVSAAAAPAYVAPQQTSAYTPQASWQPPPVTRSAAPGPVFVAPPTQPATEPTGATGATGATGPEPEGNDG